MAVIGGGASGLVSAWLLQDDHDVVLFEGAEQTGGNWHTVELDGKPVDVAASGIFGSYGRMIRLAAAMGVPLDPVGPMAGAGFALFRAQPMVMVGYGLAFAWLMPLWAMYLVFRAVGQLERLATVPWSRFPCPRRLRPYVEKWLVLSAVATTWDELQQTPILGLLAYSWANLSAPLLSPSHTPRGGFGNVAARLRERLKDVRCGQAVTSVTRDGAGWNVRVGGEDHAADAVFLALPPWRAREILAAPDAAWVEGLREAQRVDVPVVVHHHVPVARSGKLLFFLSSRFVSYRLRTNEPFRSMTPTGVQADVEEPLYARTFETDRFTGIAQLRALRAQNGIHGLWMVHSAFHPSGSRNSEQAVELAWEACGAFDPALVRLGLLG